VRRRNTELHARVNGNLAFEFADAKLTSYAGLELFDRYLRRMGFSNLIRTRFNEARLGEDFGVIAMMRVLVGLLVVGGRRLRRSCRGLDCAPLPLMLDGVVVSTGLQVERARRGYNPHHRKVLTTRSRRTWLRPRTCSGCATAQATCPIARAR
jgi:hypothetical protein